jgi:hypothetical protein
LREGRSAGALVGLDVDQSDRAAINLALRAVERGSW